LLKGLNRRELADEVHRRRPGLPVLFTSGYAHNALMHDGTLDAGFASWPNRTVPAGRSRQAIDTIEDRPNESAWL